MFLVGCLLLLPELVLWLRVLSRDGFVQGEIAQRIVI